jgi:hypothetical protein
MSPTRNETNSTRPHIVSYAATSVFSVGRLFVLLPCDNPAPLAVRPGLMSGRSPKCGSPSRSSFVATSMWQLSPASLRLSCSGHPAACSKDALAIPHWHPGVLPSSSLHSIFRLVEPFGHPALARRRRVPRRIHVRRGSYEANHYNDPSPWKFFVLLDCLYILVLTQHRRVKGGSFGIAPQPWSL